MKIKYNFPMCRLEIDDEDMSKWRNDGEEIYHQMPKEERFMEVGEIITQSGFETDYALQALMEIPLQYPVNKCPKNIQKVIENMQKLSEIYLKYLNHTLAVCLDPTNKYKENKLNK